MKNQSLFSYLKSYVPSVGRDPKEDYLTQMFAWILNNIEEAGRIYVSDLFRRMNLSEEDLQNKKIVATTQKSVTVGGGSGRIDMLMEVGDNIAFICEHKVFSSLGENQIDKYMKNAEQLGYREYYSVLVTCSELQWTQGADVRITWEDVYFLFDKKVMESDLFAKDGINYFIVREFLNYLSENVLGGYSDIKPYVIRLWFDVSKLEESLKGMFSELVSEKDWELLCPNLKREEFRKYQPTCNVRWGRIGIDFHVWGLGIFAGVLLNTGDHGLDPYDIEKGPDFCIFIDSAYREKDQYIKNCSLPYIMERKTILEKQHGDFEYLSGLITSPSRIAVLRKPLLDVLRDKHDKKEQKKALKEAIIEGINLMLGK